MCEAEEVLFECNILSCNVSVTHYSGSTDKLIRKFLLCQETKKVVLNV